MLHIGKVLQSLGKAFLRNKTSDRSRTFGVNNLWQDWTRGRQYDAGGRLSTQGGIDWYVTIDGTGHYVASDGNRRRTLESNVMSLCSIK